MLYANYKNEYKSNFLLAYPVIISQLGHTLVALADSMIIGRTGSIPLAGVSIANSIFTLFLVAGIGISYGLTPLIAQENGRKNFSVCGRLFGNSLLINALFGLLLCALILCCLPVLNHLGQKPEVIAQARPFLIYLGLSAFPLMLFLTFKQFTEGLGFTKQAMNISIWGNLLNIILGIILVFGYFGFEPMGVVGIGIATLIDRTLMAIAMGFYVFKADRYKPYLVEFGSKVLNWTKSKRILSLGIPVSLQYIFEVGAFSASAIIIGWIGPKELAAHQIALSLAALTYMMASGIAAAAGIKAGNYLGQEDFNGLRHSAIASFHMVIIFMLFTAVVFTLLNRILPSFYIADPEVISIASSLLIIAAVFQLFDGIQVVGIGILRGMGDVKIPTLITMGAYWVVGLPLGYILGFHFDLGAWGIWWGLLIGLGIAALLTFYRFNQLTKRA